MRLTANFPPRPRRAAVPSRSGPPRPARASSSRGPLPSDTLRLGTAARRGRLENGSAVLVILVLLAAMVIIISANSTALHSLKQDLQLIDARQRQKYGQGAGH